jgi:hypothetical protein
MLQIAHNFLDEHGNDYVAIGSAAIFDARGGRSAFNDQVELTFSQSLFEKP